MRTGRAAPVTLRKAAPSAVLRAGNRVRSLREDQLLTKAELARKAGISHLTLARIERGQACRVDTQRKILLALGLLPADKERVFGGPGGRMRVIAPVRGAAAPSTGRRAPRARR